MEISTGLRYDTRAVDLNAYNHNRPVFIKDIAKQQRGSNGNLGRIIISLKTARLIHTVSL